MRVSVLASGSSGNAIYIESEESRMLVDVGLSAKQIELRLKAIDVDPESIQALFITHEHIDHVKGLGVWARRYQLPIFCNDATLQNLPNSVGEIPKELFRSFGSNNAMDWQDLHVESFSISHDAADPMGFVVCKEQEKIAIVTDTGYVSSKIVEKVQGSHTLIWESNHDVEMLRMGPYPWSTKRRILSDVGHLSNQDSGDALREVLAGEGENVYLAHLSRENNLQELAHLTVKNILEDSGAEVGQAVRLFETYADRPTPLSPVKRKTVPVGNLFASVSVS
ncbi:MBL fold metallo-hydrolase [Risungbinella massiliensis]|uniref:MBL fold metallo-hydrolase n=1 Tax=Risungbinella massiliensis TaxID=1329796 RepID=UPI0005CC3886|nr:MBL fold metallo-hydrolase [Risungbinella massiliensis]